MPRISLRQRGISPNVQEHVSGQETGTSLQMALLNQTKPTKWSLKLGQRNGGGEGVRGRLLPSNSLRAFYFIHILRNYPKTPLLSIKVLPALTHQPPGKPRLTLQHMSHGQSTWCQECTLSGKTSLVDGSRWQGEMTHWTSAGHTSTTTVHVFNEPSKGSGENVFWLALACITKWHFLQVAKSSSVWLTRGLAVKYFICLTAI